MKKVSQQLNSLFCVTKEMVQNHGEDSFCYNVSGNDFLVAAFDGCGGSGSKRYENFSGKTGAYIGSRAVSGGVHNWFEQSCDPDKIKEYIVHAMDICKSYADRAGRIMGSLGKAFPTTAAVIKARVTKGGVSASCFWAGDSRCYMLDKNGLHQLTEDDLDGQDAMSNLLNDGVMTNVISAGASFELHRKDFEFSYPCILISATDGCFGYLKSPMEFEYLLTDTLCSSSNMYEWKTALYDAMDAVAGDDFTLCVGVCGFKDFKDMKKVFANRNLYVKEKYVDNDQDKSVLWEEYKKDYSMM